MKLSVIIISYNVKHFLGQCLESLKRALEGVESEVYVVDNHSHDGSVDYLRSRFDGINIIESNHNLGFARANNLAIERAKGEYILLLNPDTIVCEETIREAIRFMDSHPKAGASGVKMHNADGSLAMESRRGLPSPMTAMFKMIGLCRLYPKSHLFGKYYMGWLPWDSCQRIDIISGAFCLLRREALNQVGSLDEDFFMYGEDIDLSYRLLKGGWENWYLPLPIVHYKGESTKKTSFRYVHVFYNAMLIFLRKHYKHLGIIFLPVKAAIILKAAISLISIQIGRIRKESGFVGKPDGNPTFHCILGPKALSECEETCRRIGLNTEMFSINHRDALKETTMQVEKIRENENSRGFIVFDTSLLSFTDIVGIMASNPKKDLKLGTYSPATKTIITPTEIIR